MLLPLAKRIIVQPVEEKQGTLLIAGAQKQKRFKVKVIGDEVTRVKAGDIIYLEKHCGIEIEYEKQSFLVIDENSILAKLGDAHV